MLHYPTISPVIFQIGPIALRWYGLAYAVSFYLLVSIMRRFSRSGFLPLSAMWVEKLFVYLVFSILGWARIFYMLFYNPDSFSQGLGSWISLWEGGLSFHGGLFGILVAVLYTCWRTKTSVLAVMDTLVLMGPIGIFFGRLGNFMNGELFGRVTTVPWGMVFPNGGPLPRHPSMLYEAFFEGIFLAGLLWFLRKRVSRHGILLGIFLVGYGLARFFVEFFREPDPQLGFVLGPFTMGQLLTLGILIPGSITLFYALKKGPWIPNRTNQELSR